MAHWFDEYIAPLWPALLGGGGVWAGLKALSAARTATSIAKIKEPADLLTAMAAFQAALNQQAGSITANLQGEINRLEHSGDEMRDRIADLEHENLRCRGENRQMQQRLESLESYLRRAGIDVPVSAFDGSFITLEGDHVTMTTRAGEARR